MNYLEGFGAYLSTKNKVCFRGAKSITACLKYLDGIISLVAWGLLSMSSVTVVPTFILQIDGFFREGLQLILSRTRFSPQGCGIEFDDLNAVPSDAPSLFIVGVGQKQDLIFRRIRALYPLSFIVAVGDESNPDCLVSALDAGANAALFNSVAPNALVDCLHAITNGNLVVIDSRLCPLTMIQPKIDERLSPPIQNDAPWVGETTPHASKQLLSAREIAILERIVRGDSNKHVARFFKIAEPTVKAHVKAIFRKIGAANRTQAAIWAINNKPLDGVHDSQHDISTLLQQHVTNGESRTQ